MGETQCCKEQVEIDIKEIRDDIIKPIPTESYPNEKVDYSDNSSFAQQKDTNQKASKDSPNIKAIKNDTENKNIEELNLEEKENKDLNPNKSVKIDLDKMQNETQIPEKEEVKFEENEEKKNELGNINVKSNESPIIIERKHELKSGDPNIEIQDAKFASPKIDSITQTNNNLILESNISENEQDLTKEKEIPNDVNNTNENIHENKQQTNDFGYSNQEDNIIQNQNNKSDDMELISGSNDNEDLKQDTFVQLNSNIENGEEIYKEETNFNQEGMVNELINNQQVIKHEDNILVDFQKASSSSENNQNYDNIISDKQILSPENLQSIPINIVNGNQNEDTQTQNYDENIPNENIYTTNDINSKGVSNTENIYPYTEIYNQDNTPNISKGTDQNIEDITSYMPTNIQDNNRIISNGYLNKNSEFENISQGIDSMAQGNDEQIYNDILQNDQIDENLSKIINEKTQENPKIKILNEDPIINDNNNLIEAHKITITENKLENYQIDSKKTKTDSIINIQESTDNLDSTDNNNHYIPTSTSLEKQDNFDNEIIPSILTPSNEIKNLKESQDWENFDNNNNDLEQKKGTESENIIIDLGKIDPMRRVPTTQSINIDTQEFSINNDQIDTNSYIQTNSITRTLPSNLKYCLGHTVTSTQITSDLNLSEHKEDNNDYDNQDLQQKRTFESSTINNISSKYVVESSGTTPSEPTPNILKESIEKNDEKKFTENSPKKQDHPSTKTKILREGKNKIYQSKTVDHTTTSISTKSPNKIFQFKYKPNIYYVNAIKTNLGESNLY